MSKSIKERIEELQKEQMQLRARTQQLQSRYNGQERKAEDRRKYVIGAVVLKNLEGNEQLRKYVARLVANLPERDKRLFVDFLPPSANTPTPAN